MSGRHYGIPPGYRDDESQQQQQQQQQQYEEHNSYYDPPLVSPRTDDHSFYQHQQPQQHDSYSLQSLPPQPQARHQNHQQQHYYSQPPYQQPQYRPYDDEQQYSPVSPPHSPVRRVIGGGASSAAAAAARGSNSATAFPPPYSGGAHQALRDIDNLYSTRMASPSPEPGHERPHTAASSAAPPAAAMAAAGGAAVGAAAGATAASLASPPRPPPHMDLAIHQPGASQTSLAPLVQNHQPTPHSAYNSTPSPPHSHHQSSGAHVPTEYLGAAGIAGAAATGAGASTASFDRNLARASYYHNDGYDDAFDPRDIADDGDDGFNEGHAHAAGGAAGGAAAGAAAGAGLFKAFGGGARATSGNYGPVGGAAADGEKSEWLKQQSSGNKRLRWIVGVVVAVIVIAAIAAGTAVGVLTSKKNGDGGGGGGSSGGVQTATGKENGLWDLNSPQVKGALNNKNLHKVFPAMDYTPLNAQYPACLSNPVNQNNVTIDVAILSQLTPAIRLYGTDCNQTELVLTALDQLEMSDKIKVWLGVYLDGNATTNARQLAQMYTILDTYPTSRFAGVIVGNEVLYSKYMPADTLAAEITGVRANLTAKGIALPVSTADLGDALSKNPGVAAASDIVMANIHPFFAGVEADDGTNWAWSYWQNAVVPLTSTKTGTIGGTTYPKQVSLTWSRAIL